jgi:uncharacterized protein YciI
MAPDLGSSGGDVATVCEDGPSPPWPRAPRGCPWEATAVTTDIPDGVSIETVWLVEVPYTPEAPERRPLDRQVHLGRLASLIRAGTVIEAGGAQDWSKAVVLMRAATADEALAIIEEDVYTLEGVWHSPTARPFGRVVVDPPSG